VGNELYDQEVEAKMEDAHEMVRCLACGEIVEAYWHETHVALECDGQGFEVL
jgi:hypothetical protein